MKKGGHEMQPPDFIRIILNQSKTGEYSKYSVPSSDEAGANPCEFVAVVA
jgi:hypothetical protein